MKEGEDWRADFEQALGETFGEYVSPPVPFEDASPHECCEVVWAVAGRDVTPARLAALGEDQVSDLARKFGEYFACDAPTVEQIRTQLAPALQDPSRPAAYRSQQRCKKATARGFFKKELIPVTVKKGKTESIVEADEHPRFDTTMEGLSKLPPAFREDGSVTAGNSSGINDGACAMIVASEAAAKANGLTPRARILGAVSAGVPPRVMGIGPVPATQKLLAKLGMTIRDFDVIARVRNLKIHRP